MTATIVFLKSLDSFQKASDELLRGITSHMQDMAVPAGTTIFREGEDGDAVYRVVEGLVRVEQGGIQLVTRGPGDIVLTHH